MAEDPREAYYEFQLPFVVCKSQGGPYEDDAFVSGFRLGRLDALLFHMQPSTYEEYIHPEDLPQADLIAMRRGYTLKSEPWEEYPEEWVVAQFTKNSEGLADENRVS